MLKINENLSISDKYISINYIRSRGPGGQNVNKLNTRAQLTFDLRACPDIPDPARKRLAMTAGKRLTSEGNIIITSDRYREQKRNRDETLRRLGQMIRKALITPKPRIPTRPGPASRRKRKAAKQHRSKIKSQRRPVKPEE
ncbi:MAG: aminoacyl-tRNA hydrolase [Sedimentisphaerales bacterium]|nr:aminoacyl-tRNA hydrolase [Sedimentisphaerales bacterium]